VFDARRQPVCRFYLQGNCRKGDCRFAHVRDREQAATAVSEFSGREKVEIQAVRTEAASDFMLKLFEEVTGIPFAKHLELAKDMALALTKLD
jgi:hypothetical protein